MEEKIRDSTGTPPPPAATSEAPASEQPTSRRRQKRKTTSLNSGGGSSNHQSSSKRQAREKLSPVHIPPIHMNGPLTRARLQPNSINSFSQGEVLVKNEVEAQEAAARSEEISRVSENWEALEAKIEAEYESIKTRDASVHVVPVHAGWFSWKKIHPLEKRMLPSCFNEKPDKRNPEMYMEIRNWIMKKFHLDPSLNIELKHLSELTVGELDARQEVMEFLDYWGLINYHPLPQNEPASMNVDPDTDETQKKTNNLVEKLFKFETVQSWSPLIPMNTAVPATSAGLFPESVFADELAQSEGPSVEYHCNSCSADCSRKRYHCQKQTEIQPNIVKEPENGASAGEHSQSKEPLKDEEMIPNSSEEKETELSVMPSLVTEIEKDTGEKKESIGTKNLEIDKLKRVAVTALSAAAVKAKLLADHEEDQIRELATFVLERQVKASWR